METKNKEQLIQYGCGWTAPKGWRNFDASPTLRYERVPFFGLLYTKNQMRFPRNVEYGDIVTGLPVSNNSCRAVYCSHVLEHLSLEDCRSALINTYKILLIGGVFRFVMPDLEYLTKIYINDPNKEASIDFLQSNLLGVEKKDRSFKGLLTSWLGNSQHLWLWDYKSIQFELEKTGFKNIRRATFNDSSYQYFKYVENFERWDNCLGVECEKY